MRVSQPSDKNAAPVPQPSGRAAAPLLGGVPPSYSRLHSGFGWEVPAQFNIAQVCCERWAKRADATENIAVYAYSTRARAQFHAQITLELQAHVKDRLAPYEYPKEIEFVDALPMTTTSKVQRRVLRLQEQERARQAAAAALTGQTPASAKPGVKP